MQKYDTHKLHFVKLFGKINLLLATLVSSYSGNNI